MTRSFFSRLLMLLALTSGTFSLMAQIPDHIIHFSFTAADWNVSSTGVGDLNLNNQKTVMQANGKEKVIKTDPVTGVQEGFELLEKKTWLYTVSDKSGKELSREKVKLEKKPFTEMNIPNFNENGDFISDTKMKVFKFRKCN